MRTVRQSMADLKEQAQNKDVVLFGAGEFCMRFLNRAGDLIKKVKFICDNDPRKTGGKLYGIEIVSPEALAGVDPKQTIIIITTISDIPDIYNRISSVANFQIFTGQILINESFSISSTQLHDNYDKIAEVLNILTDERSKHIYSEVIKRRVLYGTCDFRDLIVPGDVEYCIPLMFSQKAPFDEIIVDCGAHNGDTLKKFIATFDTALKKIYTFECRKDLLVALQRIATQTKHCVYRPEIKIMPYAVSDAEGTATFFETARIGASFVLEARPFAANIFYDSEVSEVKTISLDKAIPETEKISFIKMDVEGSEYKALLGAKRIITKYKPKLAISIYHSGEDYFRLPLLVKEFVPEYNIAIRHHNKNHTDTDMYCWV